MNLYESDLAEALYEVLAKTMFEDDGHDFIDQLHADEWEFELDKSNARITLFNGVEEIEIRFNKTRTTRP